MPEVYAYFIYFESNIWFLSSPKSCEHWLISITVSITVRPYEQIFDKIFGYPWGRSLPPSGPRSGHYCSAQRYQITCICIQRQKCSSRGMWWICVVPCTVVSCGVMSVVVCRALYCSVVSCGVMSSVVCGLLWCDLFQFQLNWMRNLIELNRWSAHMCLSIYHDHSPYIYHILSRPHDSWI